MRPQLRSCWEWEGKTKKVFYVNNAGIIVNNISAQHYPSLKLVTEDSLEVNQVYCKKAYHY